MVYKQNENKYKYLYDHSDNYLIFTDDKTVESGDKISVEIQYLSPNFYTFETTLISTKDMTLKEIETSAELKYSKDYTNIFISVLLVGAVVLFLFNQMTRLFKRGGILGR